MHNDQFTVSTALATRLIDRVLPHWAGLRVRPLAATGTDNWMFRLGDDKVLRLPKRASAATLLRREWEWLPHVRDLPLHVPTPLEFRDPDDSFPHPWMVLNWEPGEALRPEHLGARQEVAETLAECVAALRDLPGAGGPIAGSANHNRGAALATLDDTARASIAALADMYPADRLNAIWREALSAPPWAGAPLWVHGDLSPSNLLTVDQRLTAVIDFGLMARGDPAVDLIPAWAIFEGPARAVYLKAAGLDPDTQARGRGWALYAAVVALAYYRNSNPVLARICQRTLDAVIGRS